MPTGAKQKDILRWLEKRPTEWFTAKQIALGISRATPLTKVSLRGLVIQSLVLRKRNDSGEFIYNRNVPPRVY